MSELLYKKQCPQCLDSGQDNCAVYDDGGEHCFGGCGYHLHGDGQETEEMEQNDVTFAVGTAADIATRGLSKSTLAHFNYAIGKYAGKSCHIANYKDTDGTVVGQKLRFKDKKFQTLGNMKGCLLFGQWLYHPNEKLHVTVCEGELDAMSIAEAQGVRYPVVSLPNGAGSAKKSLLDNMEWLAGFKYVVLCFDQDEAGLKAVKDVKDIFEPGTLRVASLPRKDASDMLSYGDGEELKQALWNASEVRPDSIVCVEDIIEDALTKPEMGISFPWAALTSSTYGFRTKQLYMVGAGAGIGKTEFIKDILYHFTNVHNMRCGILSFEQPPKDTLLRLAGAKLGQRLHLPGDRWNRDEVRNAMLSFKESIFFYDHYGAQDLDTAMAKIRYMVKALGCRFIVIDPFTALAAGMDKEVKGIDKAMAAFGALVHDLECTLMLVSHLAKPPGDGPSFEEGRKVTPAAFRGSQSMQFWPSLIIGLERNKFAEEPDTRTITTVRILKDRFSGEADGTSFKVKYSRTSGRLEEYDEADDLPEEV